MPHLFTDENFYIAVSFGVLVFIGYFKLRRKFVYVVRKRTREISKSINNAACEKEQSLLEFTRINNVVANLPSDIVRIWQEHSVDSESLHANLECELAHIEKTNAKKLADIQRMALQQEYAGLVKRAAKKFEADVEGASEEEKGKLLKQSIDLLSTACLPS
jgi:F0F1-type ATP synthase membrane subunit b/b'